MSNDFLSKFSKEKYNDTKKSEKTIEEKPQEITDNKTLVTNYEKEIDNKPIPKKLVFEKDNDQQEEKEIESDYSKEQLDGELEIDHSYHKKKLIRYGIIIGGVIIGCIAIYLTFFFMNQVTLKNFVNTSISDARTWAAKNRIELEVENVYSLEYDTNIIVSQSKNGGSKVQKGSIIYLEVSLGPDPDERISLPDFSKMNYYAIEEWITKNKANNIRISRIFDEGIPENEFIRMEFRSTSVTVDNYTRKDFLTLFISRGPEIFEKNIEVPDFTNRFKTEVEDWANKNDIILTIHEADSDTVMEGMVISQSIAALEKVAKQTEMSVTVSVGKAAVVPNFAEYTSETALSANPDLEITVEKHYSDTIPFGWLISQSRNPGTRLIKDKRVTVIYSLGRPYISGLVGMKENELSSYFFDFYTKKANITVETTYVTNCDEKGQVIWASHDNEFVAMESTIQVYVCKGTVNTIPDFSQYTAEEAQRLIIDLDITVNEVYSNSVPYGRLIFQSKGAGTTVTYDRNVSVTYSLGRPYITGLIGLKENQIDTYLFDFQRKGANITVEKPFNYTCSAKPKGIVVKVDPNEQFVGINDRLKITISNGEACETQP